MQKTRSIILHPHEIRSALRGKLGIVVRPVKPQPEYQDETGRWSWCASSTDKKDEGKFSYCVLDPNGMRFTERGRERIVLSLRDPFGGPGTRLIGKETWCQKWDDSTQQLTDRALYAADGQEVFNVDDLNKSPWVSPATMPTWASRITLEVESVRCTRVQALTRKEIEDSGFLEETSNPSLGSSGSLEYAFWWNNTNRKSGFGWDANPWVWAATVKTVKP